MAAHPLLCSALIKSISQVSACRSGDRVRSEPEPSRRKTIKVFGERITGLRSVWRSCETRTFAKKAGSLLLGKMIGLAIVLFLASKWYLPTQAYADTAPALPPPHINAINTVWTLVAAYLVFCMQVGFVMLETGLRVRVRP